MTYKFLEHTADVKFEASGKSLEEAFSSAFLALKETIVGKTAILEKEKRKISIEGEDLPNILYKFLEDFLFLLDSEGFIASKIESIKIDKKKLQAVILGDKAGNYKISNDVKAITYNGMFVKHEKGEYVVQVVLDV